ncbi:helix-turn-helix domain-containing protein [Acidovorax sp. Be4]|jgi:transcriptional regulator with XRE-family HTH domain|uniref:Helix-turn-helix domain-containing protein n=1 Tax=Acidovorax bellezanensis TaxID=2976702 RepID=A0ABT2PL07_9BURK|nr:helix-turn-helix domain-containing protein [Acidovorax sp. Be4]MCT9811165.1 helix-turn-helix domain-containing protein [Acidovorax sp. Be4]
MQQTKTPEDLELELGEQLRQERLRQNITMEDLCLKAGVSKQTLRALETGAGSRVISLIRVIDALGHGQWLTTFRPPVRISPLQIARGVPSRQRAARSVYAKQMRLNKLDDSEPT